MLDKPLKPIFHYNDSLKSLNIQKDSFLINNAKVDSIDIIPENQKDKVPVLVVPGHSATKETLKPGMEILAQRGRRAISFDHPRTGGIIPESQNEEIIRWYKERGQNYPDWPSEELRKAHTILGLLDQKKLDKVDVIAYSEAAINVCIAAMLRLEKFTGRTIVLYSPAGLIGEDTFLALKKRAEAHPKYPESMLRIPTTETEIKNRKLIADQAKKYNKANHLRSLREGVAVAKTRIEDMLRYLHEKGVQIIVIQGVDDTFFPINKMQKIVKSTGLKSGFVDGFLSVIGGHLQIQVHPELIMPEIEKMLSVPKKKI